MLLRLARLIVFLAAVQILGGHWLALQSVAWAGMLASYARGETFATAIEKTFDGEHPCGLCKVVKSARADEQKQQVAKTVVKLEAVLGAVLNMPMPRVEEWKYLAVALEMDARSIVPPIPPPKAV